VNKFEERISGWNFKKIVKIYILSLIIAAIACAAAAYFVYQSRISFAWQYSQVKDAAEKNNTSDLQTRLGRLAASSSDVVDILVLDGNNNVIYSAKNSEFAGKKFSLYKTGSGSSYLVSPTDPNVVFKYVKSDSFMLNSVFNTDFGEVKNEYKDESFYEDTFSSQTVYMLSFLGEKDSTDKIYIISNPTSVPYGALTIRIIGAAAVLFFMIYWALLALWIYADAAKSKLYAPLWGIAGLLTNLAGLLVYQIYKHANASCPFCGASQSRLHRFCSFCGAKMGRTCPDCGAQIGAKDRYCHSCGAEIKE